MHLLIKSYETFIRSYTIKIPLIRSYTIKILLIRSYTIKILLIRSYTIKIPLIRSYTIKIPLIRSYTIKIPLIRSYTIKIPSYQFLHDKDFLLYKFLKHGIFFILKTIQSCSQAVAEKLQHATLKCQSNNEKNILYFLLRLIRYCKIDYLSDRGFLRSGDYQTGLKIFFKHQNYLGLLILAIVNS